MSPAKSNLSKSAHPPCKNPGCPECTQKKASSAREVTDKIKEITNLVQQKPEVAAKILADWIQQPRAQKKSKKSA